MTTTIADTIEEWAKRIPVGQIPSVLVFLAGRLVAEGRDVSGSEQGEPAHAALKLLTANELAGYLNLPETWVRSEERMGHIPSIRAGKYVRFKLNEVEKALAGRKRVCPQV